VAPGGRKFLPYICSSINISGKHLLESMSFPEAKKIEKNEENSVGALWYYPGGQGSEAFHFNQ